MNRIESPRTDDNAIEQEIKAKGLTAPRVTPADIEAEISSCHFFTAAEGVAMSTPYQPVPSALSLLTFCVLTLRNGFTVTGESACASPENFDAEVGRKVARANAVNKVWPLLGYALKEKLANVPADHRDRVRAEAAELDERIAKLSTFGKGPVFAGLPAEEQGRMNAQLAAMESYSLALHERIAAF
jgi:hypothetical protein